MKPDRCEQRGVVLIVVLWVVALLLVLLAAFVTMVKTERQTVADVSLGIQAHAATEAVLGYMAALVAVGAPELEEMPGQRYELVLNDLEVSFRLIPESLFIPVNTLDAGMLETVFAGMELEQAAELAAQVVEWRSESVDESTGEVRPALRIQSMTHLAHLLGLDLAQIAHYERWLSFVGEHEQVMPGHVPGEILEVLGLSGQAEDMEGSTELLWEPAAVYRVQVQVPGRFRPRQMEAIASFTGTGYDLLQINEYNVEFSLDDLSE